MKENLKQVLTISCLVLIFLSGCNNIDPNIIEPGVSKELAKLRNRQLSQIKYSLKFKVPEDINDPLLGHETIEFEFNLNNKLPLVLDFRNPASYIKSVKVNHKNIRYNFENEHIIINSRHLQNGKNQLEIEFIVGERALNRNKEYLYTLFVPDRACTAFPCFDQPSLKAEFQAEINVPAEWTSVGNTSLSKNLKNSDSTTTYIFANSKPISTYLFSFVAGKFESITKTYEDREMTMYHREDDLDKLENNKDQIFDLHYDALKWLEEYTQIDYPFSKFDFVVIPSFQYSGMEHPGAILYRDTRLMLEQNASIREQLNRANLIAHETAHMWFGDLVTMEWFSEVWLKEVFANFMAGKIVNPQYPDVNHDLNFLINHYPSSYSVDRSKGANPIEQQLDNMNNAGTLYGSIIYHKAPIVMNKLETITGKEELQEGLQEYLNNYEYSNATWDDLINILDLKTENDLKSWSQSWVYEPGMPKYVVQRAINTENKLQSVILEQKDPFELGRQWKQDIEVILNNNKYKISLEDTFNVLNVSHDYAKINYIFPNSSGLGYGYFQLDSLSAKAILQELKNISDPVIRCSMYISLWENMLNQNIKPIKLLNSYIKLINAEEDPQNINLLLSYIKNTFWQFLTIEERNSIAHNLESLSWNKIKTIQNPGINKSFINFYKSIAYSQEAIDNLLKLWKEKTGIKHIQLTEQDITDISLQLAVRNINNSDSILFEQLNQIKNPEKKERFRFIMPAVSENDSVRDSFFESLQDEINREKEPWVIDALYYLHHPLKSKNSVKYIRESLNILEELQITGDIFFPKRWLDATFAGHNSLDAVLEINLFLNENPDYPENLKNKILQSTDLVYRASIITGE